MVGKTSNSTDIMRLPHHNTRTIKVTETSLISSRVTTRTSNSRRHLRTISSSKEATSSMTTTSSKAAINNTTATNRKAGTNNRAAISSKGTTIKISLVEVTDSRIIGHATDLD